MIQRSPRCLVISAFALVACASVTSAENVTLATNRVPAKTIVIPTNSGTALQATAAELATFLSRITTGTFVTGTFNPADGPNGSTIVLGLASDLNLSDDIPYTNPKQTEQYLIGTANSGSYVVIAGATELAVADGVYDWLEKLGCRWFFPTANWEIVPSNINLKWTTASVPPRTKTVLMGTKTLNMNVYHDELPDYKSRFIWFPYYNHAGGNYPYGEWMQQYTEEQAWSRRNRNVEGIKINFNHNYAAIVTWAKKPENNKWDDSYYAKIEGSRVNADPNIQKIYQFCAHNPAVVQLVQDYTQAWFSNTANAKEISVSMEPNDGSYWCDETCEYCGSHITAGETITDRTLILANAAAEVTPDNRFVGLLAYGTHADTPTDPDGVNDKIYVNIATGYLIFGKTFDELLVDWGSRTPNVGVYDYFSNFVWDLGMPNRSDGSNLEYISTAFPSWRTSHADNYNAQSTYSFGMLGLGHYLAMKVLWDTGVDVAALRADFIAKCFGTAAVPMDEFYRHIDNSQGYRLSTDLIGRLYGFLDTAYTLTMDPKVIARLDDLALWVRYCELRRHYNALPFKGRQQEAEDTLRFAWKMRATSMLDTLSLWRIKPIWGDDYSNPHNESKDEFDWPLNTVQWNHVYVGTSGTTKIYQDFAPGTYELEWDIPMVASGTVVPEGHPWKEATTYNHGEILNIVADGIANNPLLVEEPRSYSSDLVPSNFPAKTGSLRGTLSGYRSKVFAYYMRSDASGILPTLQMSTGWGHNYGPLVYRLYTVDGETELQNGSIVADKVNNVVTFSPVSPNTNYLLICDDSSSYSKVSWAAGAKVTIVASSDYPMNTSSSTYRYFYVPKGTKNVLAYAYSIGTCTFYNASGTNKYGQPPASNGVDITIAVDEGEDDSVWYVRSILGTDIFMQNIPGMLATSPDELLIPKDALIDLLPSGAAASTRGSFLKMYTKNAFYIRGDAGTGILPTFTISNGWSSMAYGNAEWTLYTEDGKTALESGTIAPTQVNYTVAFTTTSTNDTYLLVYDDKKGNSKISWDAGELVSIAATPQHPHTQNGGASRRYFFVPKGTTNVTYKAKALLACNFYNAAGTLKHTQAAGTNLENGFPVAPGDDDQFWYVTSFGSSEFYFANIPGYLGTSPDEMLIPHWTFLD